MLLIEIKSDLTTVESADYTTTGNGGICEDVVCENGGYCTNEEVPGFFADISAHCLCPLNWTGQYCENGKITGYAGVIKCLFYF